MIIDYQADYDHARQYEILDAMTWQPLPMDGDYARIWYADDQKGILRIILQDENGMLRLALESDPQTPLSNPLPDELRWAKYDLEGKCVTPPMCIAWREERRPIRIVRKAEHVR